MEKMATKKSELSELNKQLTMKVGNKPKEEQKISIELFIKIINWFDDNTIPVKIWFQTFKQHGNAYNISEEKSMCKPLRK